MATSTSEAFAKEHYGPGCCPVSDLVTVRFGTRGIRCHPKAKRAFKRMKRVFKDKNRHFFKMLDEGILNDWSYNCRTIAGSTTLSNHSFGIAVDWNSNENYRGLPANESEMWKHMRESIEKLEWEGVFHWGGRWSSPDAMHFEVALTPKQLRERYTWTGKRKRSYWKGR